MKTTSLIDKIFACLFAATLIFLIVEMVKNYNHQRIYSSDECKSFKIGDTIFTKEFYTIKKVVVLNNYPGKEIIEVRDLRYDWDVSILSYDDFRFKN